MARVAGSYSDDLDFLIKDAVEAGVFGGKSEALREFVREYFQEYKDERTATAVAFYRRNRPGASWLGPKAVHDLTVPSSIEPLTRDERQDLAEAASDYEPVSTIP